MLSFLAIRSFEEYEDLAVNLVVKSKWENPFNSEWLYTGHSFFFPMVEHQAVISIWMILVALMLLWYIAHVNRSDVYVLAMIGFALLGLDILFAFNTLYPSVMAMLLACAAIYFLYLSLVTFLIVLVVNYLPYFNVNQVYLYDRDGNVRKRVLLACSVFIFFLFKLSLNPVDMFIQGSFGNSPVWYWTEAIVAIFTGALAADMFLPWNILEDKDSRFDDKALKEIKEPFIIDDDKDKQATVRNLVGVGLLMLFTYVLTILILKIGNHEKVGMVDAAGFLCLVGMCMLLARAIIYKFNHQQYAPWETAKTEIKEIMKKEKKKKKNKNPWTDMEVYS
ncbi:hypothetical protein IJT93_13100 [bacterium]|nr:hypothetical protein [bacterium]